MDEAKDKDFWSSSEDDYSEFICDTELRTFRRTLKCFRKDCNGVLRHTGGQLLSNPPQYPHECSKCGFTKNLRERYPSIVHKSL